jgi:hypothetical protein
MFQSVRVLILLSATSLAISQPQLPKTHPAAGKAGTIATARYLKSVETIDVPSEVANFFIPPLRCDEGGNLYLNTDQFGIEGFRKLNPKGVRLALFNPGSDPDHLKVSDGVYFSLDGEGNLYQLIFLSDRIDRYIFEYKKDGTLKSKAKLETGFPWMPAAIAPFSSGGYLVTGQEYDREPSQPMWPVTAVFSSTGALLREVKLEDDESIRDMAESGDRRVVSPQNPTSNRAIGFSQMESASDGNVYLMRWLSAAILYAISPGGQVIRRFSVDPVDPDYTVAAMHISGNRIAILFVQPQTRKNLIKVTDLEGRELTTYKELGVDQMSPPQTPLGASFACYAHDPEQFIFLESGADDKLQFVIATPR